MKNGIQNKMNMKKKKKIENEKHSKMNDKNHHIITHHYTSHTTPRHTPPHYITSHHTTPHTQCPTSVVRIITIPTRHRSACYCTFKGIAEW